MKTRLRKFKMSIEQLAERFPNLRGLIPPLPETSDGISAEGNYGVTHKERVAGVAGGTSGPFEPTGVLQGKSNPMAEKRESDGRTAAFQAEFDERLSPKSGSEMSRREIQFDSTAISFGPFWRALDPPQ